MIHTLNLQFTTITNINNTRVTLGTKEYSTLEIGRGLSKYYIDPWTKDLIVNNCSASNMEALECRKGIFLLNNDLTNLLARIYVTVKKSLTEDMAILTAVNSEDNDTRDYVLKKHRESSFMFEEPLIQECQKFFFNFFDPEAFHKNVNSTIEYILDMAEKHDISLAFNRGCEIFKVTQGPKLDKVYLEINDILGKHILNDTHEIGTLKQFQVTLQEGLPGITSDFTNLIVTGNTESMGEQINISKDVESWTELGVELINNTAINLTKTLLNATDEYSGHIHDENTSNTTSLFNQYANFFITAMTFVGALIIAGFVWYAKNKHTHYVSVNKDIIDIPSTEIESGANLDSTSANDELFSNIQHNTMNIDIIGDNNDIEII